MGVANENSIAWAIAKKLHEHGAKMVLVIKAKCLRSVLSLWWNPSVGPRF